MTSYSHAWGTWNLPLRVSRISKPWSAWVCWRFWALALSIAWLSRLSYSYLLMLLVGLLEFVEVKGSLLGTTTTGKLEACTTPGDGICYIGTGLMYCWDSTIWTDVWWFCWAGGAPCGNTYCLRLELLLTSLPKDATIICWLTFALGENDSYKFGGGGEAYWGRLGADSTSPPANFPEFGLLREPDAALSTDEWCEGGRGELFKFEADWKGGGGGGTGLATNGL